MLGKLSNAWRKNCIIFQTGEKENGRHLNMAREAGYTRVKVTHLSC